LETDGVEVMIARYILLHGAMFRARDKAPFIKSGESVLGALEYDPKDDLVKCHECGEWHNGLFQHVSSLHGESSLDYKERHGLAMGTALCGLRYSKACSARVRKTGVKNRMRLGARKMGQRSVKALARGTYKVGGRSVETLNLRRHCALQLIERIKELASELSRTPSFREMRRAGIPIKSLITLHGSVSAAVRKANLIPRLKR
jgi:hypothetical protein